jgi:hypothetical protein
MGMLVEVIKSGKEDKNFVYYNYKFATFDTNTNKSKMVSGELKIDKRNGDVHTLSFAESDKGAHARCAAWALMKHWKKGEYPTKLIGHLRS